VPVGVASAAMGSKERGMREFGHKEAQKDTKRKCRYPEDFDHGSHSETRINPMLDSADGGHPGPCPHS
jgi:hypothetical protein